MIVINFFKISTCPAGRSSYDDKQTNGFFPTLHIATHGPHLRWTLLEKLAYGVMRYLTFRNNL